MNNVQYQYGFIFDLLPASEKTKYGYKVFNNKGTFTTKFRKYLKENGGFYNGVDLLEPLGKAVNPITGNPVKRETIYTKAGTMRKKYKEASTTPQIQEQYVIDSFQSFVATRYITKNVTTLAQLFQLFTGILDTLPQQGYVKLFFRSKITGAFIFRSITAVNMIDLETFEEFVDAIFQGSNEGSDGVDAEEYELYLDMFDITQTLIGGDGEALLLFKCTGISTGTCYRDVLDHIDGLGSGGSVEDKPQCAKCDKPCVVSFGHKDGKAFWGCDMCRTIDGLKSYPSFQHEMSDEVKHIYRNANPKNRYYDHFMKRLVTICNDQEKNVNIYANSFTIDKEIGTQNIRKQSGKFVGVMMGRSVRVGDNYQKIKPKKDIFYPLSLEQFPEIKMHLIDSVEGGDGLDTIDIVFDPLQQHYDIIEEREFSDGVCLSGSSVVCQKILNHDAVPIYQAKHLNRMTEQKQKYIRKRLIWDVETVMDRKAKNVMMPYSVSFCELTDDEMKRVEQLDGKKDSQKLNKLLNKRTQCIVGYDCLVKFVQWIIKNQQNTRYELVSFNGSNFDHFLLLDTLLDSRHNFGEEAEVSNIFYNGSSILSLKLQSRHTIFDLARHVVGSLDSNCKGFKVNCVAKSSFDHNHAQQLHDNGELIGFMTGNTELIDYNNRDVWSLAVIFQRYCDALGATDITKKYANDLCSRPTVGGMVWDVMRNHWQGFDIEQTVNKKKKVQKIHFPKLDAKKYADILKYKTAGRVQLFNGVQRVEEKMCSKDIASMYPYVMGCADVYFPCGDIVETDTFRTDKIGFYYCDIDQSILKKNNLPNIVARKEYAIKKNGEEGALIGNDWDYDGVLHDYCINSVTIQHLRDNGCDVVVKSGFYFTDKARSCDVFEPVLKLMGIKIEEDLKKRAKDSAYNPSLRETCKLLMNSVSGKVIEGLHLEKVEQMTTDRYAELLAQSINDDSEIECISAINICGTKLFCEYKKTQTKKELSKQRPVYLGCLIYAYAQRHIYETGYKVIGLKDLVYTDTDSFKARATVFERPDVKQYYDTAVVSVWDKVHQYDPTYAQFSDNQHPIYSDDSKVFGSYEEELPENDFSVFAQKKGYIIIKKEWYNDKTHEHHGESLHAGFKGVPMKSVLIDSLDLPFIGKCVNNHKDGTQTVKFAITDQTQAVAYANDNTEKQIKNNAIDFANQLYDKREAYVLTTSFRKIVKNTKVCALGESDKYVDNMHKVQVVAVLKKITVMQ